MCENTRKIVITNSEASEILKKRNVKNWEVKEVFKSGGQGFTFKVRNKESGDFGVFKFLKNENEINLKRFEREITFLARTDITHENIIRVLDYSIEVDNLWYVTQLGEPFETYWKKCEEKYFDQPEKRLKLAIKIVKGVLNGLSILHSQDPPIVHRDVKPPNIVIIDERPALIDFGTVYLPLEERLTDLNHAVGNKRYSPDPMRYRMEDIMPWLDIFMVSQVLIWMISENPEKRHWDRPLDYRYVRYPASLEQRYILSLHAFTGLCAEETLAPKNAAIAKDLLDKLFYFNVEMKNEDNFLKVLEETVNKAQKENAKKHAEIELERLEEQQLFENHSLIFEKYYDDIERLLGEFTSQLEKVGLKIRIENPESFTTISFIDKAKDYLEIKRNIQVTAKIIYIHKTTETFLPIKVNCVFDVNRLSSTINPFWIHLISERSAGTQSYGIEIHDGLLFGGNDAEPHLLTDDSIKNDLQKWMLNPIWWIN